MANEQDALKRVEQAEREIAETLKAQESKIGDVSQKLGDELKQRNAAWEASVKELRAEFEKSISETNTVNLDMKRRLEDAELRLGHPGGNAGVRDDRAKEEKSLGEMLTEKLTSNSWSGTIGHYDPNVKGNFDELRATRKSPRLEVPGSAMRFDRGRKATLSSDVSRWVPPFRDQMLEQPRRILTLLDYMPHIPVASSTFEYYRHLGNGPATALSMTSIAGTGTSALATTGAAHGLQVGDFVSIEDSTDTDYNGVFRVLTVPSTTTFTYEMLADPADDTADGTIVWRPLSFGGAAEERAEGAAKAEVKRFGEMVTGNVRSIAHFEKVSQEILDDIPQMQAVVNNDLIYGVELRKEKQALYGTGSSNQVQGILTLAGRQTLSQGSLSAVDVIRRARTMVALSDLAADLVVMNPLDWEAVEIKKGSDDHYVLAAGAAGSDPRVWRLPVLETNSIRAGKVLVGAFGRGSAVYDRQTASIEFTNSNEDDFEKNLITIRGEARVGFAWKLPQAFVDVTFTG